MISVSEMMFGKFRMAYVPYRKFLMLRCRKCNKKYLEIWLYKKQQSTKCPHCGAEGTMNVSFDNVGNRKRGN